jgi:rhodanese-related sulfurtransferase
MAFEKLITEAQAVQMSDAGAMVVDLRDPIAFRDGALTKSINSTLRQISNLATYPKPMPLVLIGDPTDPATLKAAVRYLEGYGLTNVSVFTPPRAWKP